MKLNRIWWLTLPVLVALAPALSLVPRTVAVTPSVSKDVSQTLSDNTSTKNVSYAIPLLERACSCESWGDPNKTPRQFYPDGSLIRGNPNPSDVGACQINEKLWLATSKKLGLNIEKTLADNIRMANYIYSVQGMNAWNWSKSCWGRK